MSVSDKILELRTHREAIREAINDKGVVLAEGSPMSDYAGAINEISGGEVDYSNINGYVKELYFLDGVVRFKLSGGNTLALPQEPHAIISHFLSDDEGITTLVNTEYVTEIGYNAFYNSSISGDLSFPKVTTLLSLGNYSGSQFYSTGITSIDLPLVENLPYAAFSTCRRLKFVNIPNIKTIHADAFRNMATCETIILGETIPDIYEGTAFLYFLNDRYSPDCQIQVPPHMVDVYKADAFWSQYADRIIPYPEEV